MGLKDKTLVKQEELSDEDKEYLRAKFAVLYMEKPDVFKSVKSDSFEGPVIDFFLREVLEDIKKLVEDMQGNKTVPKDLARMLTGLINIVIDDAIPAQKLIDAIKEADAIMIKYGGKGDKATK
jgi:hypothetical protein